MGNGILDIANTSLIFWEIITVAILLFLLYWFVYPPIRDQIQRRQQSIEQAIDEAEKTRNEARQLLEDYRQQIEEAREEADRIVQRAREEINRERESALREVRTEVAGMVIQASEQIIGRSIDRDDHERLISQALDELEAEVTGASSGGSGSGGWGFWGGCCVA